MSPIRAILQLFLAKNHHVITEKLASSYPVRRAAQLVAHFYFRLEGIVLVCCTWYAQFLDSLLTLSLSITGAVKRGASRAIEEQSKQSQWTNQGASGSGFGSSFRRHLKEEMEDFKRRKT